MSRCPNPRTSSATSWTSCSPRIGRRSAVVGCRHPRPRLDHRRTPVDAVLAMAEKAPDLKQFVADAKGWGPGPYLLQRVVLAASRNDPPGRTLGTGTRHPRPRRLAAGVPPTAVREITVELEKLVPGAGLASAIAQPERDPGRRTQPGRHPRTPTPAGPAARPGHHLGDQRRPRRPARRRAGRQLATRPAGLVRPLVALGRPRVRSGEPAPSAASGVHPDHRAADTSPHRCPPGRWPGTRADRGLGAAGRRPARRRTAAAAPDADHSRPAAAVRRCPPTRCPTRPTRPRRW